MYQILRKELNKVEQSVWNDVETKSQSSQWRNSGSPRPEKTRQVRSNVKVMLSVFIDFSGIVHHEFLPRGQTINKEFYLQV